MRSIYWTCAVCALFVAGLVVARQTESKAPKKLAPEEIVKLLKEPGSVIFVDVREPNEIAVTGTVKGALTIPVGQLEGRLSEVSKGKAVVPFCKLGGRAARAANLLEAKGYKTVGVFGLEPLYEQLKDYIVYPK
jgi:rhodanese-related sulfurtransferase